MSLTEARGAPGRPDATGPGAAGAPAVPAGTEPAGPALRLRGVAVGYGDEPVVAGVDATVAAGRWLAVIGPNGAGKSTLLKAMAGILPFAGEITGVDRGVAYVPQQPSLPAGMSTAEYVLLGRTAHLAWFRSESAADRRRVAAVLDRLDLGELAGRPVTELSGGEAQRATLARALVQEARILVLDEPTSALDLAHQIGVLELIDRLRHDHGLAVVTAMHDLTTAGRFADQLLLVAGGRAAASGTPAEVLTADVLSCHYGTPVSVLDGPDGVVVVPLRTPAGQATGDDLEQPGGNHVR